MNEYDIKDQLKKKNKEIYLNKLNFDLDNNLEVLVLTIDNLLSFMKDNLVKKIIDIEEDFQDKESILENVNIFFEAYRNNLMNILDTKKVDLQNVIVVHDDLDVCKQNIKDNYLTLKETLETFSKKEIDNLVKSLNKELKSEFKKNRLKEYLTTIFLTNLNMKVLDTMKNRDIILINTFEETYLKYLELNKNTIGV
ncbi:MAG: hypothetical protein MR266_01030 [Erysipelotrichaceae bacterium]|nr:hypothetical protein [Erysipelotrichaceae bacterium]